MSYIDEKPDLEYLAHFGVKGMKWGVRKVRDKVGRIGAGSRERFNRMRNDNRTYKTARQRTSAEYGSKHPLIRTGEAFAVGFTGMSVLQFMASMDGESIPVKKALLTNAIAGVGNAVANEGVASYDRWKYEREVKKKGRN